MTIEERLELLERQNRRLRLGLGFAFLFLLVIGATGLGAAIVHQLGVPAVITARAFHVLSKDGKPVVRLEGNFGMGLVGSISTYNGKGRPLVWLAATKSGEEGVVVTLNGRGQELVVLGAPDGKGMVRVFDPSRKERRGTLTTHP